MADPDMNAMPLKFRLEMHHAILVAGWEGYLGSYVPSMLDGVYTPTEQADMTLQSLGIAACRWAANPDARPKKSSPLSGDQMLATMNDGRDPVRPSIAESMADAFHGAFQYIGKDADVAEDMRAMVVPQHLSAIRVAASNVFARLLPGAAVLATLDQHLREHLPTGITWMNVEALTPNSRT